MQECPELCEGVRKACHSEEIPFGGFGKEFEGL